MSAKGLAAYKEQCLQTIRELVPLGYWLLPLVPFTAKVGGTYIAPDGSVRRVQKENDPGKCPILPNWQKVRLTEAELIDIFSYELAYKKKQPYNMGVACGPEKGLITLDVDFKNGGGEFLERYTAELEDTGLWEHTGNGVHIHFLPPAWVASVPNVASGAFYKDDTLWKGVELKSDGTQVVTFPSIHPTAKRADKKMQQYRFEHDCGLESRDSEMSELTEEFFGETLSRKRAFDKTNGHATKRKPKKESDFHNDEKDIERLTVNISQLKVDAGERNSALYRVACKARDHSISPSVCRDVLLAWNETNCSPPLPPKEIVQTISHAYHYSKGDAGANSLAAMLEDSEAYKRIEVPEEKVQELEKEGGTLPIKKPSVCARRLYKRDPRVYLIGEAWFVYSDETESWERKDKDEFEDRLALLLTNACPDDVNLKWSHVIEVYRALRAVVRDKTNKEKPELRTWLKAGSKNHNEVLRVENGIVDLHSGELLPHSSEWFSTTKLSFNYDPAAECPRFLEFLDSIWGHEDEGKEGDPVPNQASQLKRFMGWLVSSDMEYHKYGLFIGVSRAGKGVLERLFEQLIGKDNSHSTTLDDLGGAHGTMSLPGKQLCLISDAEDINTAESKRALQRIKSMSGGDSIPVNPKYGKPYDFQNTAKIVMTVNEFPRFIDPSSALYNRTLIFHFTKTFAGREDRGLDKVLQGELPGIFNWAVRGFQAWKKDGVLTNCPQVQPLLRDMKHAMNPIAAFISAAIEVWKPVPEAQWDAVQGPWDQETPPEEFSESKKDLIKAFEACQQQDNRRNWISNRKFIINLRRELCSVGWLESWGEFRPWSDGSDRSRRILGIRLRSKFKNISEFGNLDQINLDDLLDEED